MKLRRMSIRNVKAIPALEIDFDERITLLHGANGIGKSTILDCVALLGHLAAMRRLTGHDSTALQPSPLVEMLRQRSDLETDISTRINELTQRVPPTWGTVGRDLAKHVSLDHWFDDDYIRVPRIRYQLEIPTAGDAEIVSVIVAITAPAKVTVSHILNRSRADDLEMADNAVVLAPTNSSFDHWLAGQALASTSLVRDNAGGFRAIRPVDPMIPIGQRVVAINTDLSDLGKRDQVRESVKDLNLHLANEIARLNLPFDSEVGPQRLRFRFFDDLSAIIARVITDPSATRAADEPFLRLTSCDIDAGDPKISFRRANEQRSFSADFLSAGENECFFIFLTLLGIDTQDSIIVLDEPELHVAEYCRPAFFAELYGVMAKRRCQVIVATHSLFAVPDQEPVRLLVIGRTIEHGGQVRYTCGQSPEYSLALFKAYWRTGVLFLGAAGAARPLRALASAVYGALARLADHNPLGVALIVGVISSAIVSLASDLAKFIGVQTGAEHFVVINLIVLFGLTVAATTSLLLLARRAKRRRPT